MLLYGSLSISFTIWQKAQCEISFSRCSTVDISIGLVAKCWPPFLWFSVPFHSWYVTGLPITGFPRGAEKLWQNESTRQQLFSRYIRTAVDSAEH